MTKEKFLPTRTRTERLEHALAQVLKSLAMLQGDGLNEKMGYKTSRNYFLLAVTSILFTACVEYSANGLVLEGFELQDGRFVPTQVSSNVFIKKAKVDLPTFKIEQPDVLTLDVKFDFVTVDYQHLRTRIRVSEPVLDRILPESDRVEGFPSGRPLKVRNDLVEYRAIELKDNVFFYIALDANDDVRMIGLSMPFTKAPSDVSTAQLNRHQQSFAHNRRGDDEGKGVLGTYADQDSAGIYLFFEYGP